MSRVLARADVAVVGIGAMGAMALWQLAARGASVVGIERFRPGHDRGSSHGGSRVFRLVLPEGSEYVDLARVSLTLWRELEQLTGQHLLTMCGGLVIGPRQGALIQEAIDSAEAGGIEYQLLDHDGLLKTYPQHALLDDDVAAYEATAGVLRPEAAIKAAVDVASDSGASILERSTVLAIALGDSEVQIMTEQGVVLARQVILSTGAWLNDLLPEELVMPVRNQRSCNIWFQADSPRDWRPERFPVFGRESGDLDGWGIPDVDGLGVKIGAGASANKPWLDRPEDNWSDPTPRDLEPVQEFAQKAFVGLGQAPSRAVTCMNNKTPDGHFILGRASAADALIYAGGFHGHGFKHASGIGQILAQIALDGGTDLPIDTFSPDRFSSLPADPTWSWRK